MKKLLLLLALCLPLATTTVGCNVQSTQPTQVLAPGYINQADQQMKGILDGAAAFYNRIKAESDAGRLVLTVSEKAAFNNLGVSINVAQPIYLAFHNGTGTQANAQNAVNAVSAQQTAVQNLGVK